jgi:hypothetical protein
VQPAKDPEDAVAIPLINSNPIIADAEQPLGAAIHGGDAEIWTRGGSSRLNLIALPSRFGNSWIGYEVAPG